MEKPRTFLVHDLSIIFSDLQLYLFGLAKTYERELDSE